MTQRQRSKKCYLLNIQAKINDNGMTGPKLQQSKFKGACSIGIPGGKG